VAVADRKAPNRDVKGKADGDDAAALRRSNTRYELVMRATKDVIWDWDLVSGTIYRSERLLPVFGYATAGSESLDWWKERLHPEDRETVAASLEAAVSGSEDLWAAEYRFRRADGSWAHVLDRGLISCEAGVPHRMVGVMMDVSERRELQARMTLNDRLATIGTLAGGIAHEINNPLAYVLANTSYALETLRGAAGRRGGSELGEVIDALAEACEGAERVRNIVRDIKTISRPETSRIGHVDLRVAMDAALTVVANEIRHRATLDRDYSAVSPVDGNESRLAQIFVNLLLNAAQAIPFGATERNRIRVSLAQREDGMAVAEISDTGKGIPPEILPRIFDPFFTTRPVGEGTGLGLAICHGIVKELGGSIEVESTPGQGSTFRVLLPTVRAATAVPAMAEGEAVPAVPRRLLILAVDDEVFVLRAIERLLGRDHDVVTTMRARDVLARLDAGEAPDVILCDLMMPELTGMELYDQVRQRDARLARRIVFMTGGAFTARAAAFLEQLENPCLEKPFDGAALRELVLRIA
jgi:PAS domain S-box-containing protein